jgi:uncharacterized protein (DUF362 family)
MKRKEIVLTKETRKTEFVKKVMDAISPHLTLKSSHKVAIKINLSGPREIYANTNTETVESLISYLRDNFGISDISVVEGSDGAYYSGKTTWDIFYKFRYKEIELNGSRLVNLDELPHENELEVATIGGAKTVNYAKCEADYVINVVPPKTHNIFPVCMSIVNMLGFVKPEERAFMFGSSGGELKKLNSLKNEKFLQLLEFGGRNFARLVKEIPPSLTLIDGLYGMEGKGPIKGSPVFHGFSVASEDVVLADALTTFVMGFEVDVVPYLSFAYREGLGNNRWQNIIGVDPSQVKFPYRPHPLFPKQRLWAEENIQNLGKPSGPRRTERGPRYPRKDRDSRGEFRGDRERRGDSRDNRNFRENRGEGRKDNRNDNRGDNRSDNRSDNRGDSRSDSRSDYRGDNRDRKGNYERKNKGSY